jgi:hypothetical protein
MQTVDLMDLIAGYESDSELCVTPKRVRVSDAHMVRSESAAGASGVGLPVVPEGGESVRAEAAAAPPKAAKFLSERLFSDAKQREALAVLTATVAASRKTQREEAAYMERLRGNTAWVAATEKIVFVETRQKQREEADPELNGAKQAEDAAKQALQAHKALKKALKEKVDQTVAQTAERQVQIHKAAPIEETQAGANAQTEVRKIESDLLGEALPAARAAEQQQVMQWKATEQVVVGLQALSEEWYHESLLKPSNTKQLLTTEEEHESWKQKSAKGMFLLKGMTHSTGAITKKMLFTGTDTLLDHTMDGSLQRSQHVTAEQDVAHRQLFRLLGVARGSVQKSAFLAVNTAHAGMNAMTVSLEGQRVDIHTFNREIEDDGGLRSRWTTVLQSNSMATSKPTTAARALTDGEKARQIYIEVSGLTPEEAPVITCGWCCRNPIKFKTRTSSSIWGRWNMGHDIAAKWGGSADVSNLLPMCRDCNMEQRTDDMLEFANGKSRVHCLFLQALVFAKRGEARMPGGGRFQRQIDEERLGRPVGFFTPWTGDDESVMEQSSTAGAAAAVQPKRKRGGGESVTQRPTTMNTAAGGDDAPMPNAGGDDEPTPTPNVNVKRCTRMGCGVEAPEDDGTFTENQTKGTYAVWCKVCSKEWSKCTGLVPNDAGGRKVTCNQLKRKAEMETRVSSTGTSTSYFCVGHKPVPRK